MKDIYELLNDINIDENEFEEIQVDDIEKQKVKKRLKESIKNKRKYKNILKISSIGILSIGILSSGFLLNKDIWANIEDMWYSLQELLEFKNQEVGNYKYEINKSVESKDIKVTYKSLMIEDGNLIIEMNIDDSKFDLKEDLTEKQQKDWFVDKWYDKDKFITLEAGSVDVEIDGERRSGGILSWSEDSKIESDGSTSLVMKLPINVYKDEHSLEEVKQDEFPNNIEKDRVYNIKLDTKRIHLATEWIEEEQTSYAAVVRSNWSIDIPIKGEDLIKSTLNYEEYKIDKSINMKIDDIEKEVQLDSIKVSPLYVKLQYTTDINGYNINDKYGLDIKLENENGEEYQPISMTPNDNKSEQTCTVDIVYRNIFKDNDKIKFTPVFTNIRTNNKYIAGEQIGEEHIIIDLNK